MRYALLLILSLTVFLSGCGNDQYAIEKQYWQTQKEAGKVFGNPHASPPQQVQRVIAALSRFIKEHPKTRLAVEADFNIARLLIVKEEYEQGRKQLRAIIAKYADKAAICAEALFLTGNSFEIQDKWGAALMEYKKIMQEYPITQRGLSMPIYISAHYKIKLQMEKMRDALQEAIAYYQGLAAKYVNTPLAYNAHALIAQCYAGLQDWQKVIDSLDVILTKYKGKVALDEIMMNKAMLYYSRLKDKNTAIQVLEQMLRDYPKSKLSPIAENMIKKIQSGKKP